MGCGAVRGCCHLSLGSVLRRVPLFPSWVNSSNMGVTVAVLLLGVHGCAMPLRWLLEAQPCHCPAADTQPFSLGVSWGHPMGFGTGAGHVEVSLVP